MLPNIAKLQPMLERMTGPQLQQFAAMHHDNAVAVGLAMQIDKDRKKEVARLQALMSGQKQPTVVDQALQALGGQQPPMQGGPQGGAPMPPPGGPQGQPPPQGMPPQGPPGMQMPPASPPQLPEQQGIGQLPAPNMEQMADGGIAGYADGGEIRMAGGTPSSMFENVSEDEMRARGREYGISEDAIERFIRNRKGAAAAPQRDLPFTPATTEAVAAPKITALTGRELYAGQEPMLDFVKRGVGNLLPGGKTEEYDIAANRAKELPVVQAELAKQREARSGIRNVAPPSAEEYAAGRPVYGDATMPPPSVPPAPKPPAAPQQTFADLQRSFGKDRPRLGTGAGRPSTAGIDSLIPEGATVGKTPEQAILDASKFSLLSDFIEGQTLLNRAGERRDKETLEFFKTRPSKEVGQKAEAYIEEQRRELEKEKGERGANFLISAGLAMAAGTSRNAMQNIAQGLQVGFKDAQAAMKDFKAAKKDLARMDADLENLRDAQKERDFDREFSLRQRIADRDESRKQNMLDGTLRLAGGDRALAGNIYSLANQTAEQWKQTKAQFGFTRQENEANRAASAANTQAQIEAQKQAALFAANLPSAQARFYAELGGAPPGTVPTSTQIRKGVEFMNSVNDIDTALAAYEKQALEHAKAAATTGAVLPPMKDKQAWIKEFMEQKRAYSLFNQGIAGGIPTTSTPGNAPVYGR